MRSFQPRSEFRAASLTLLLVGLAPGLLVSATGCEDQLEPRAYLGPTETPPYVAPPVHKPGTPAPPPSPAPTEGLVEPPPATVTACTKAVALPLSATEDTALGLADSLFLVSSGSTKSAQLAAKSITCPSDQSAIPLSFDGVDAVRTLDGRGTALVAGLTGISAAALSGDRAFCGLSGAKAVAHVPGTETGFAITGSRELQALDWSSGACEITSIGLSGDAVGAVTVVGTLAVATSPSGPPWIATAERDLTAGAADKVIARARRFDTSTGTFDEFSPVLGGQAGTICGVDALAVTDDGERVAVLDGACGRVLVFRASDGELLGGVSAPIRGVAPVPNERAFLTVASVGGVAVFSRLEAQ